MTKNQAVIFSTMTGCAAAFSVLLLGQMVDILRGRPQPLDFSTAFWVSYGSIAAFAAISTYVHLHHQKCIDYGVRIFRQPATPRSFDVELGVPYGGRAAAAA